MAEPKERPEDYIFSGERAQIDVNGISYVDLNYRCISGI